MILKFIDRFVNTLTINAFDGISYSKSNLIKPFALNLSIIIRLFLRNILFRDVRVQISKKTQYKLKKYLERHQLLIIPSHTFIIETLPIYELFGKINKPFYLMVAREFFDLAFGFVKYPLQLSGCFSVLRGDDSAKESLEFALNILSNTNKTLILFPEGECSLNLKATLPSKRGTAILIQRMNELNKPVAILPLGFKFIQDPNAIPYLEQEIKFLENKIHIAPLSTQFFDYKRRILNLIDTICNDYLSIYNLTESFNQPLLIKVNIVYQCISLYLQQKYKQKFYEERKYEIYLKNLLKNTKDTKLKQHIENDIRLIYTWIEIKGLMSYIPDPTDGNIAVWAGLLAKLMRIVYQDYSHKPVQKITKFLTIEPILHKPIPCSEFKEDSLIEIQEKLDTLLSDFNYWLT